jgi:acyl carrier protein
LANSSPFEFEVAQLIVKTLHLKIDPSQIDPTEPLFGDGLGLDSIDALELALGIYQTYGYKLRSDDPDNVQIFSSLRSLSETIQKNRSK